jgi:hypothetical protein
LERQQTFCYPVPFICQWLFIKKIKILFTLWFDYNFLDEIDEQNKNVLKKQQQSDTITIDEKSKKKPWITLVSYVDELTVGGRRDSKGNFVDAAPSFPGFGRNKQSKAPQECFPYSCYQR